jgi:hypothetical protein
MMQKYTDKYYRDMAVFTGELYEDIKHLPIADQMTIVTLLLRMLVDLNFPEDKRRMVWNGTVEVLRITPGPGESHEQAQNSPSSGSHH